MTILKTKDQGNANTKVKQRVGFPPQDLFGAPSLGHLSPPLHSRTPWTATSAKEISFHPAAGKI